MFKLGHYYLDICQLLFQKPKPIDPSHYIARFASNFGLGQKTLDVVKDALKLAKSLKLDYLEFGKRPAGVSGVCLLLASRMNHFNRSIDDIAKVVKVSPITIKRRLREFASTGASSLTIGEFRDKISEVEELPEFNLDQRLNKIGMGILSPPDSSGNSCRGANSSPSTPSIESPVTENIITPAESCNNDDEELNDDLEEETDLLSDTELDKELDNYLLNPSETLEKQKLWELENEEFYQAQQIRLKQKALLANNIKSTSSIKRKRDYNYNLQSSEESVNKILKIKQVPKCFEDYASETSIKKLFNK
jgi:transcription factor IIIB subunit 2